MQVTGQRANNQTTMETINLVSAKSAGRSFHWALLPWLVLVTGIPTSFLLFTLIQDSVGHVAQLRFERATNDANDIIEGRLRSYSDVLFSLRALFASEDPVNRLRFHQFVESLDLKQRYPGFLSLNYAAYVTASDKQRFEAAVRRDTSLDPRGYPQFAIKPPGERKEYFVAVYLEPMAGFEFGFGLDLGANPMADDPEKVAATVRLHRDSGSLRASAQPLRVKNAKESIYLAMRLAVYQYGMPVGTVEQRRAAYRGSVGAAFGVESLMRGALNEDVLRYTRFRLYDTGSAGDRPRAESAEKKQLLFDSAPLTTQPHPSPISRTVKPVFVHTLPVEIAGRAWQFEYSAPKDAIVSETDRLLPPLVLAGGLLSSALLFGVFYFLAFSRSRAVALATEMTTDLRASTEQLTALSRQLVDVQESERRQFSRELHDRIGQNLTALSINLDILKSQLTHDHDAAFIARLDDSAALLDSTSGAVENVMSDLRPPMLDDYGLLPALQWYGTQFSERTGIHVEIHGDDRMQRLPPAAEIALFRIAQEALNNVAKHARATRADIALERADAGCAMRITDDGVGLAAATQPASWRPSLGMVTMRERIQAVGGSFEISAAPGGGTQVTVRAHG